MSVGKSGKRLISSIGKENRSYQAATPKKEKQTWVYRDEAGRFLDAIHASDESVEQKIMMLQHELDLLKSHVHDVKVVGHQAYDLLFLLFEIASQYDIDLDSEWLAGQSRKSKKYL